MNYDMRDAFISGLYNRALIDRNIIFLSAEFGAPSLDIFRKTLPEQFINVGISEQNLISVAAGLALEGKKVYAYSIASFITLRCYEQIKIDLCTMNLPVTLLGVGPCYAYSVDGPTHHATEDISIMRALANMTIFSPTDSKMASSLVDISLSCQSPMYIRLDRGQYPLFHSSGADLSAGLRIVNDGSDICIIATGCMVHRAVEVASLLRERNISARVIDLYRLKPLDKDKLRENIQGLNSIITIEEHTLNGGLGGLILEAISDTGLTIPVKRLGIADSSLYNYGLRDDLHRLCSMDAQAIERTIITWGKCGGQKLDL